MLRICHWLSCLLLMICPHYLSATEKPPNVILIYADDLGWGDLGCYGHPTIHTPHLDRLASQGVRFTQFYSAAEVCTPSRAALLTGRYPIRSGMCHNDFRVLRNNSRGGLPKTELTIAEMLKAKGYATACVGKWHLGHLPEHLPQEHGFDEYFGMPYSNDMQSAPDAPKGRAKFFEENNAYWRTPLLRGKQVVEEQPDQRKLTDDYTREATKFIERNKDRPFFLYFPHNFPHVPLFASPEHRGKSRGGIYGDVVEEIDASVGRIMKTLRDHQLEENTLVIFSSDNGPWLIYDDHGGSAGPLKEGKGSTWEGGMRVPGIFYWPAKIKPQVQREVALTMDILPTLASIVGAELPTGRVYDGVNIMPLLTGTGIVDREAFMYYRGSTLFAVRKGPWKAHVWTRSGYGPDKAEPHETPLLYHLEVDLAERRDVAAKHPEVIQALRTAIEKHQASLESVPSQLIETVNK